MAKPGDQRLDTDDKAFPSQKDVPKQMIQLPSKIHEFKASCFSGLLARGRRMGGNTSCSPAALGWHWHCSRPALACSQGESQPSRSTKL